MSESKENIEHVPNSQADGPAGTLDRELVNTEADISYNTKPSVAFATLIVFSVTFIGFTFGFDTGTISGITGYKDYIERFGELNDQGVYHFTTTRKSLIVSFYSIGAGAGAVLLSGFSSWRGRKPALLVFLAIMVVGNLVQITSNKGKWYQMFIGRIISGVSAGSLSTVVPMYAGELSPAAIRGGLVSSYQLFITLAIFLGYCVCYATKHHNSENDSSQWRIILGLNFLWAIIIYALVITVVPESPRYLIEVDKVDEARKTIAYVNRVPINSKFVDDEITEIEEAFLVEKSAGSASWTELITGKPKIFQRVFMGFMIMALQQLTGINYFFYYGTSIFSSVGLKDTYQTVIVLGIVNFAFTILSLWLSDKFGRRATLIGGSCIGAVALYIYTILGVVALYPDGRSQAASVPVGNAMIFLTTLFIASFAASWGAVGWVILSESFPIRIRSKASSIGVLSSFLWNFLIAFFTPYITNDIHFSFGFIFAGCLTFSIFYVYFIVYETKGLTLEEVDILYASKDIKPWTSANWKSTNADEPKTDSTDVSAHEEA